MLYWTCLEPQLCLSPVCLGEVQSPLIQLMHFKLCNAFSLASASSTCLDKSCIEYYSTWRPDRESRHYLEGCIHFTVGQTGMDKSFSSSIQTFSLWCMFCCMFCWCMQCCLLESCITENDVNTLYILCVPALLLAILTAAPSSSVGQSHILYLHSLN